MKLFRFAIMLIAISGFLETRQALADVTLDGTINQVSGNVYTVDRYNFTVNTAGTIVLNIRANEHDGGIFHADLNNDGEWTRIDGGMALFNNDGNPLSASNLLASNDDYLGLGWNDDGSAIGGLDPYLLLNLAVGDYSIVFGEFHFLNNYPAINAGQAPNSSTSVYSNPGNLLIDNSHADYRLTITGDVTVVHEPSTIGLVGLMAMGLIVTWRRKSAGAITL